MARPQKIYICDICGYRSNKWLGKCPSCGSWNSFREIENSNRVRSSKNSVKTPLPVTQVSESREKRIETGIEEFDRVLGGGIVEGSVVLVGGQPGVGKSTLLLQVGNRICEFHGKVLYVSGEESETQIGLRAGRLGINSEDLFLISETDFDSISRIIEKEKPSLVIIDSVQTMYVEEVGSVPGSVVQVREVAYRSTEIAKKLNIPIFLIGHVTKEGNIAGPSLLEHIVDTVLYFEGDSATDLRVLRSNKNRFGPTNEVGIFEMTQSGLIEVKNPSALFLEGRQVEVPGSSVTVAMEGTRPFLIEIQALVSPSPFAIPRRTVIGLDPNRVSLLIAILEKRAHYHIGGQDVFVNVVGGMRIQETASDFAVISAIASSFREKQISPETLLIGEVGLVGEVRRVKEVEKRVKEAVKSGFSRIIIPATNYGEISEKYRKFLVGVKNVAEALEVIFDE